MKANVTVVLIACFVVGCGKKPTQKSPAKPALQTTPAAVQETTAAEPSDTGDVIDLPPMDSDLAPIDDKGMPVPPAPPSLEGDEDSIPGLPPIPDNGGELELPGLPEMDENGQPKLPGLPPLPGEGEGSAENFGPFGDEDDS